MPLTGKLDAQLTRLSLRSGLADLPTKSPANASRGALPPRSVAMLPVGNGDRWLPWEKGHFDFLAADKTLIRFDGFFRAVFGRAPPAVLYFAQVTSHHPPALGPTTRPGPS